MIHKTLRKVVFFGTFRRVSRYVAKLSYLENPRYIYQYCIFFCQILAHIREKVYLCSENSSRKV